MGQCGKIRGRGKEVKFDPEVLKELQLAAVADERVGEACETGHLVKTTAWRRLARRPGSNRFWASEWSSCFEEAPRNRTNGKKRLLTRSGN